MGICSTGRELAMKSLLGFSLSVVCFSITLGFARPVHGESGALLQLAQSEHSHGNSPGKSSDGMHNGKTSDKGKATPAALKPAEGAAVKILTPKTGQTLKGDKVELQ